MNRVAKNISVDAGIIMIADRDYFEKRNPGFINESLLWKEIVLPAGKYHVVWKIPKTWNGNVAGDGILEVISGRVLIGDPCYILGHVPDKPNFWSDWLDETHYAEIPPEGTLILDKMGGDGCYDVHMSLLKAVD
jgi:hypothetical protein